MTLSFKGEIKMILVKEFIGANCITMEQGEIIYQLIYASLKDNKSIELDFSGIGVFASPFFNVAIGRLLKDFSREQLNRLLIIKNLSSTGRDVLKVVIENSEQYFKNEAYRRAVDDVIRQQGDDI